MRSRYAHTGAIDIRRQLLVVSGVFSVELGVVLISWLTR